jgi:PAS domain S-box-containing protein
LDERFKKINRLLSSYSTGNFDKRLALSPRLDEVDAFIAGVNMLGEELKTTTISRDYFNNIFNSVSDMVFVVNNKGLIQNTNNPVMSQLGCSLENLLDKPFDSLAVIKADALFPAAVKTLKRSSNELQKEILLRGLNSKILPVLLSVTHLINAQKRKIGFLITAKDITLQKQTESLIIRTITDTQEKERQRFAKDIHDSIGQQISAIKFYIGTSVNIVTNEQQRQILLKSNDALVRVLADMRNICFNLMPKTLETFGLVEAVKELCSQTTIPQKLSFRLAGGNTFPRLDTSLEIAVFRIVQEFISNAIKHGKASKIDILFSHNARQARMILKDNGTGFDISKVRAGGMGLKNIQSRVKAHNGNVQISSKPGKGTKYELTLPVNT